jgi:hypothetical protein
VLTQLVILTASHSGCGVVDAAHCNTMQDMCCALQHHPRTFTTCYLFPRDLQEQVPTTQCVLLQAMHAVHAVSAASVAQ